MFKLGPQNLVHRRRRRGGRGGFGKRAILWKIRAHFSGKNHAKFWDFVNFSDKYNKNSGILLLFRQESGKTRAFC